MWEVIRVGFGSAIVTVCVSSDHNRRRVSPVLKWKFWLQLLAPQVHRAEAGIRSEANDVLQKFMRSGIAGAIARPTDASGLQIHVGTARVFPVEIEAHILPSGIIRPA